MDRQSQRRTRLEEASLYGSYDLSQCGGDGRAMLLYRRRSIEVLDTLPVVESPLYKNLRSKNSRNFPEPPEYGDVHTFLTTRQRLIDSGLQYLSGIPPLNNVVSI